MYIIYVFTSQIQPNNPHLWYGYPDLATLLHCFLWNQPTSKEVSRVLSPQLKGFVDETMSLPSGYCDSLCFYAFSFKELCPIWPVFVGWVANQRLTTLGVSAGEPRWQKIAWFWPCVPVGWLLFRLSSDNGRNLDLLYRWVVILSMMVNHNQITIWGYLGSMFVSTMS